MLILSRKVDESIIIGNNIEIKVIEIKRESVKLGIQAEKNIPVHRKEIYEQIVRENKDALELKMENINILAEILRKKP
jgi:carbon storage regulator